MLQMLQARRLAAAAYLNLPRCCHQHRCHPMSSTTHSSSTANSSSSSSRGSSSSMYQGRQQLWQQSQRLHVGHYLTVSVKLG
jgi:hypothetical protein